MKLVIDIPKELAEKGHWYTDEEMWAVIKAVQNGTVLPNIKQECNERESEFMRKARLSMQESAYLDQGITQC